MSLDQDVDAHSAASTWNRSFDEHNNSFCRKGVDKCCDISDDELDANDELDYAKQHVESPIDRQKRYFSLAVITFTAFTFNLSFSIILTSAKPYLDQMDPEAGTQFLGLFIAAQPLAQLFFSPLMGYLGNTFKSIRILSMISMTLLAAGFVLYGCVSALPEPRRWHLFTARFLIGSAAGSITLCFSYIASATTIKERTTAISLFSLAGSTAFVLGPVIQLAFAPLGVGTDLPLGGHLYMNLFTGPSFMSAAMALINGLIFLPCVFTEYNMAKREGEFLADLTVKKKTAMAGSPSPKEMAARIATKTKTPDTFALIVCIVVFASVQFNFIFLESVATLLTIEQLGLSEKVAIVVVGLAFAAAGIYSGLIFALLGPLARKLGERSILTFGIVLLILGPIVLFPYGGPSPPIKYSDTNQSIEGTRKIEILSIALVNQITDTTWIGSVNTDDLPGGCPIDVQPWCDHTPAIRKEQLLAGFVLIVTGFPMGAAMTNSIFSKIIGPFPQGTWMGILGAGACFARVLCPICVTAIYSTHGPMATFAFMTGMMSLVLILLLTSYRRLVPYRYEDVQEPIPYLIT